MKTRLSEYVDLVNKKIKVASKSFNYIKKHDMSFFNWVMSHHFELSFVSEKQFFTQSLYHITHSIIHIPICQVCNLNECHFLDFKRGYKQTCSNECRKKLANHRSTQTQIEQGIYKTTGIKNSQRIKNLTPSQKKEYQIRWLESMTTIDDNGLTGFERANHKRNSKPRLEKERVFLKQQISMANKSEDELKKIHKKISQTMQNKSSSEKHQIYLKRKQTMIHKQLWVSDNQKPLFWLYRQTVERLSNLTYNKYQHEINPTNIKRTRNTYHLDHIVSIKDGFVNNIPPFILASKFNLRIITAKKNISKYTSSDMSHNCLIEKFFHAYSESKKLSSDF